MRRFAAILLLCCLLGCQFCMAAYAAPTAPDATQPIMGLRQLEAAYAGGERLTWTLSASLEDYLGVDKVARQLMNGLLADLSARYEVQENDSELREILEIRGGEVALLSLTRWLRDDTEWVASPQLETALAAEQGTGLLTALLGEAAQYWPQGFTVSVEPLPAWDRVRAGLSPNGSPEEGYACLLEGEAGIEAALALLGTLRLNAPDAPFQWLPIPTAISTAEPVSIFWLEDKEGQLSQARLAASFSTEGGVPWVLSLSMKRSTPKNGDKWELTGQISQGEDQLGLTWTDSTTLSGKQIKRQMRLKVEGTLAGAPLSLDMRQNDTNTFALTEEGLAEKLTRSLTVTSSYKSEAAVAQGWNALSLEGREKSNLFTTDETVDYAGTLEMKLSNGNDDILAGTLTFAGEPLAPVVWSEPAQAQHVDVAEEGQRESLAGQGQVLLDQALAGWLAGLPMEVRQQLLLP